MLAQCLICSVGAHIKKCHVINPSSLLLSLKYWQLTFLVCMFYVPKYSDHVMLSREFVFCFFYKFAHIDVCMIWINDEIGLKQLSGVTSCDLKR